MAFIVYSHSGKMKDVFVWDIYPGTWDNYGETQTLVEAGEAYYNQFRPENEWWNYYDINGEVSASNDDYKPLSYRKSK